MKLHLLNQCSSRRNLANYLFFELPLFFAACSALWLPSSIAAENYVYPNLSKNAQASPLTGFAVHDASGFPAQEVGTTSAPMSVTFTFAKTLTIGSISVVTQGVPALDFQPASGGGGTCSAGTTYGSGKSCTVEVVFSPKNVGLRMGQCCSTTMPRRQTCLRRNSSTVQGQAQS